VDLRSHARLHRYQRKLPQLSLEQPHLALEFAPLTTARLTLRPFRGDDAADLHRLINDWEVCRTLPVVPYPYPRKDADAWIAFTETALREGREFHLAITRNDDPAQAIVGSVGIRLDRDKRAAKLGYWVGRKFWGVGIAREAASRLCRWALANLDIARLEAQAVTDNAGSIAVLRHIGFRHVGDGEEMFKARGSKHRVLRFEATRTDLSAPAGPAPAAAGAKPLLMVAACALIDSDTRVLLARRPEGKSMAGLWEFPGGKLNPGETPEAALIRELKEELGIDVASNCLAPFAFASHGYDSFHLVMPLFLCRRWRGTPTPREAQTLAWVRPDKLATYPMPDADLPLIPLLRDFL
jgi:8-oxo-dGTP diphosphatase